MKNKRNFGIILLALSFLLVSACAPSGTEVLATFNGGKVLRSEMRKLFVLELGPQAAEQASIQKQTAKLRQIGLMKIVALESQKVSLDPKLLEAQKRLKKLHELEAQQLAYTYELKKNAGDFEIPMLELQFLYLRQDKGTPSRKAEAEEYQKKLNALLGKDTEIEDFIQKHSEHGRYRWLGGYLDPICLPCDSRSALLGIPSETLQKLIEGKEGKEGKFVLLSRPNDYLVFRKIRQEDVPLDDLEDYQLPYYRKTMRLANYYAQHAPPPDKAAAKRAAIAQTEEQLERANYQIAKKRKQDLLNRLTRIQIERLRKKLNFSWKIQDAKAFADLLDPKTPGETVVFRIAGKPYTKRDLLRDIKSFGLDKEKPENLPSILNGILIPYKLLAKDETFQEARQGAAYRFFQEMVDLREKNKAYFSSLPDPEITEKEIRDFYKKRKNIKRPLDSSLKKQIRNFLQNQNRNRLLQARSQELAKSYNLVIHTKLLKPNQL